MPRARPRRQYEPAATEKDVSRRWERARAFAPPPARRRGRSSFVTVIPPPNITGSLHLGHALNATMQDALVRYHRMRGDDTVWVPGTDHAGIATQNVVEKELKKEGKTRHDLGRDKFLERVWAWKERYGSTITEQLRRLGCSCDWTRERFTLDPAYSQAVNEAFIHYAQKGLIYRGERIINWCPRCASAISDLEVEHREEDTILYTIRYGPLTLATVRPETKFGDTGVVVNPRDRRYTTYVGKEIEIEDVLGRSKLRVVADEAVDPNFGTGVMKVTPAHDFTDFEIGERHGFPPRQVIGEDGRLNERAGRFAGMTVAEARPAVVSALNEKGLLVNQEPYRHTVGICARCGTTVEPLISKQWFVKMAPLVEPAIAVVEQGLITFHPARWKATYLEWLRGVKDWCISRQLWWGHRLPVWYCQTGKRTANWERGTGNDNHAVFSVTKPRACLKCGGKAFTQDPDVLDTWFSSALWPFAVFGWPEDTPDLRRFYPTAVLMTDKGILNLWVARMVFSALEFMNPRRFLPARAFGSRSPAWQIPFRHVLIHPTVLNRQGQRMSKSLGTGVDPLDLIREYGADATRFGLLLQSQEDQQALRFDPESVRTGRNFVNKLWNIGWVAARVGGQRSDGARARGRRAEGPPAPFDAWILHRLAATRRAVTEDLETFRCGEALRTLRDFVWDDLADWYVETTKVPRLTTPEVFREVFGEALKLLHPFLPFVTEALWKTSGHKGLLAVESWLAARHADIPRRPPAALAHVKRLQIAVRDLRAARALLGIPAAQKIHLRVRGALPHTLLPALEFLAGCRVGGRAEYWARLPARGPLVLELDRQDLSQLDLPARLAAAEEHAGKLKSRVRDLKARLARMRGKAPAEATATVAAALADEQRAYSNHETTLTALRTIARKAAQPRGRS